jgi:alcohol dehydrogenase (cytochrome c)
MRRCLLWICGASVLLAQPVPYERILNAAREPQNWLTYWGDYGAARYRTLDQIGAGNVKDLRVEWMFQTGVPGAFQTVPLVVDGIMYFTTGDGSAYALDAQSGRQLWRYKHAFPRGRQPRVNRGLAALDERLFMVTGDANLVALDARTGRLAWQTDIVPYVAGTYYATLAAAGYQRQNHRGHLRGRGGHARFSGCLPCGGRQARLALLDSSRQGRTRGRNVGRRLVEARRRATLDDGHV